MNKIRALINDDLDKIKKKLKQISGSNKLEFIDIKSFVCEGSKQIRSILAILYLKSNNIEITENIITLLSAGEIIHNASLLHDDVIDNAEYRRGKPNLSNIYSAGISVLTGDFLLSIAVKLLLELQNTKILTSFLSSTQKMSNAEIFQYSKRNKDLSIEDYLIIAEGKTASLFESILESSAILADMNTIQAKKFGRDFGIIFQINNDFSEDSIKNDIQNGLKTAVNILGIEKSSDFKDNYKQEMRKIIQTFPDNKYKQGLIDLIGKL